jgi:transposase
MENTTERKKRRTFTREFKAETVKLVLEEGKKIGQVARDLGVPENSVRRWVLQAKVDSGKGPAGALTTVEREELTRLRKQNRELLMEREILKKATAFFAKESK